MIDEVSVPARASAVRGPFFFTVFHCFFARFTEFYRVLPSLTGFNWVLLDFIGFYLVSPSFT